MTSKCEGDSVIKESRLVLYIALMDSHCTLYTRAACMSYMVMAQKCIAYFYSCT